jgi:carboxymethylenebutenolidase
VTAKPFLAGCLIALAGAAGLTQTLPPLPEQALATIERSPRHGEWVGVEHMASSVTRVWLTYPERRDKAPVVLVLHRLGELDDWTRAVVDQLAANGYIAVAPELAPAPDGELRDRIASVLGYGAGLPAANGRSAVVVLDDGSERVPRALSPAAVPVVPVTLADDRGRAVQQAWRNVLDILSHTFR